MHCDLTTASGKSASGLLKCITNTNVIQTSVHSAHAVKCLTVLHLDTFSASGVSGNKWRLIYNVQLLRVTAVAQVNVVRFPTCEQ
jgi:hypothetical protein